ncbi:MAG: M23 family metallopeptidase [Mariniphaga sp.]|nr:M23 family metallopeptidase [Mariniphaga sp.]
MAKRNYRFNPETLSYERIGLNIKRIITRFLTYFSSSLALALLITFIIITYFETPKMKSLKSENQRLLTQYELMGKDLETIEKVMAEIQQRDDNIYRVIFESEPIPSSIRKAGFGGANKYSNLENMDNANLVITTATKLDILLKETYIQSKSYDDVMNLALSKEKMLASIPAVQPVSNKDLKRTASGWGYRIHPIYKIRKFHYGMDFTAPTGTEIYATGDGKVTLVKGNKRSKIGFGLEIKIDHGFGYVTLYGHLNGFNVKSGQLVKRGDVIGYIGNSGGSTAPHLHYEIHKNGKPVNPEYYYFKDLTPQEYEKMVAISSNMGQSFD